MARSIEGLPESELYDGNITKVDILEGGTHRLCNSKSYPKIVYLNCELVKSAAELDTFH